MISPSLCITGTDRPWTITQQRLLIKGQDRTLACQMLGIEKIPAIIVDDDFAENEKVQQFLVENVARLRMQPVDRALLITHARQRREETADVAQRFGVSPATVRRLEAQLDGASKHEVAALKKGAVNLTLHAVPVGQCLTKVDQQRVLQPEFRKALEDLGH